MDDEFSLRGLVVVLIRTLEQGRSQAGIEHANEWREKSELDLHCEVENRGLEKT